MAADALADTLSGGSPPQTHGVLSPHHQALLTASGISTEVAAARGYRSETVKSRLGKLGFKSHQWYAPCLVVPVWGVDGTVVLHQIRPDTPRERDGKPVKYETPAGARMRLDVHPSVRSKIGDPKVPLYITEGVRKADAAVSKGLCCLALLGVWNWRGKNAAGGKTVLPDWESVALADRQVYIAFDSDAATNEEITKAVLRLKGFLESRGSRVRALAIPAGVDGVKAGLDDYLAGGHTAAELKALPPMTFPAGGTIGARPGGGESPYRATPGGLVRIRETREGAVEIPLTNFDARIVTDVVVTDGEGELREFDIEAMVGGRLVRVTGLPAEGFGGMDWVSTRLGAEAVVYAGAGVKDHARAAIQLLSGAVTRVTAYSHLGWARHEGRWVYRHSGGAIGADPGADHRAESASSPAPEPCDLQGDSHAGPMGPIPGDNPSGVGESRLPTALSLFRLPPPPHGDDLVAAIRASLRLLAIGPDHVTLPLYAGVWRAPLGPATYSLFVAGPTGTGKSTAVALFQQHFGAGMDHEHLPAAWASTANANEALAYLAKDALMVVDDFLLRGTEADVQRAHRDADRLLRAQGNHSGRGRCDRSGSPREGKRPRGLLVCTGEATPDGESLNARTLVIELNPGDVMKDDRTALTARQGEARDGLYAKAMAGYLGWLAARYEAATTELRSRVEDLRVTYQAVCRHARTATIVADLIAGFEFFGEFATECGAVTEDEYDALWYRLEAALLHLAGNQNRQLVSQDPIEQFLSTLRGALLSGEAHVADLSGVVPAATPAAWGWEEKTTIVQKTRDDDEATGGRTGTWGGDEHEEIRTWIHRGKRVGWVEGENLYLEIAPTLAVVLRLAKDAGQHIPFTQRTLGKALSTKGLLKSREEKRDKYTRRVNVQGRRTDALHLDARVVVNPEWRQADFLEPGHEYESDELLA